MEELIRAVCGSYFSTLDSGLRDETSSDSGGKAAVPLFQYPQPRVYAMKPLVSHVCNVSFIISVPSTSGLRDETDWVDAGIRERAIFQYPQPRVYAMKLGGDAGGQTPPAFFQYPQPRVYAMKPKLLQKIAKFQAAFSTLNLGSTR